jgi:hypothetical protein
VHCVVCRNGEHSMVWYLIGLGLVLALALVVFHNRSNLWP